MKNPGAWGQNRGLSFQAMVGLLSPVQPRGKFNLDWDDGDVLPDVLSPDVDFLLRRMNEATYDQVSPKQGELILDIGCGRAIDGVELAKKGARVIGLEPSRIMIAHAKERISQDSTDVSLICGLGEYLPAQANSVDKVVCKGALDHFSDPELVMGQIAIALKPGGKAIISIANFESLGFRLGRRLYSFSKSLGLKVGTGRMPWEIPPDHTFRLDHSAVKQMVKACFEIEDIVGISLFFGFPWWGAFLSKCPRSISLFVLKALDRVAYRFPYLSDVVILKCKPKG